MANTLAGAKTAFARLREKRPFVDHLVQAGGRFTADAGNQLAAAITFFSFLSLFPLILLALAVLGFVLKGNPELQAKMAKNISGIIPGSAGSTVTGSITNHAGSTSIVGVLGLLYSGLGWIANLRTALRTVWHQNVNDEGGFAKSKIRDLVILIGLGIALGASIAVSGVGNAATSFVIDKLGLGSIPGITVLTKLAAIAIGVVADILVVLWLFIRLPRVETPIKRVFKGALFGAIGFEILKIVGAYYIGRTTKSPTYGALGGVVGALVWINLVSRFFLFTAVWTVTAPYDDDVAPSGTADAAIAREAGIPEEFAEVDRADNLQGGGEKDAAPTPLRPALMGKPAVGFDGADPDTDPTGEKPGTGRAGGGNADKGGGGRSANGAAGGAPAAGQRIEVVDPYRTSRGGSRTVPAAMMAGAVGAAVLGRLVRGRTPRWDDDDDDEDD